MNRLLNNLNEAQLQAVTTTEGPLLVVAGAGSGKTRVLTRRLAYILTERKAAPHEILAVTFTNKAAGEMKQRVAELLGGDIRSLQVSTFHSFCARLLRSDGQHLGYDSTFTIFDQADALTLLKNCVKELGFSTTQFSPKAQLGKISRAKNKLVLPNDFSTNSNGYFEKITSQLYGMYQSRLRQCNAMDFDDLLVNSVLLLKNHEAVGTKYRDRFKYILVDEYQDTNHVQYLLLKNLVGPHKNICVVGDEDQSIYGWRGADIRNILDFERDFPGARTIKLEQNYRSTKTILRAASSVIKNNEARKDKTLRTDNADGDKIRHYLVDNAEEEAIRIVDVIDKERDKTPLKEQAILYRTNAQSRPFEEQLRRRSLPYQIVGGITFYERKEIKDLLAYLKLIANPRDEVSFGRVINYPKRGLGDKSLEAVQERARAHDLSYMMYLLSDSAASELGRLWGKLAPFVKLIEQQLTNKDKFPVDHIIQDLVEELGIIDLLKTEDEIQGQTRVENVEALIEGMSDWSRANEGATLEDYLSEISLFTDLDQYSEIEDKVTLMTIHSAKGLEYDTVYLVGLEEGLFPLERSISEPMALEEERRLFYVGATRARRSLMISTASSRFRFGEVASTASRFVGEMDQSVLDRRDFRRQRRWEYETSHRAPSLFDNSHRYQSKAKTEEPVGLHYEYEGLEGLQVGCVVQHPTFGRGRVTSMEGYGESLRLEIMFSGIGIKKIMAKYARLKVIG
ncbi:MAG TPA: UvrD-helicase domain-containing protein [candidate division Zixibacteria bacterium]|nr:UvrD-helicase domain-containing protein [candidate division Zixibacteria bacterium]